MKLSTGQWVQFRGYPAQILAFVHEVVLGDFIGDPPARVTSVRLYLPYGTGGRSEVRTVPVGEIELEPAGVTR